MVQEQEGAQAPTQVPSYSSPAAQSAAEWRPGQPAPSGFVVVPEDRDDDGVLITPEHLGHAEPAPGTVAVRATATAPLTCVVSGEEIAAGEEYIDGGEGYGPVKVGWGHMPLRTG